MTLAIILLIEFTIIVFLGTIGLDWAVKKSKFLAILLEE